MSKLIIFVFSLTLLACASSPDSRPGIYVKGENLLTNGVLYYKKDNFSAAQHNFKQALKLYQSIDNPKGIQLSRINLLESLLALNNFGIAEAQLAILKNTAINELYKDRVVLLEVKLLFQKQQYRQSLSVIEPLLLDIEKQGINDKQLKLLATAARLEALTPGKKEMRWLNKFREVILQERKIPPNIQVILKRIDAVIATQNQHYQKALTLLQETLGYYKERSNRRAIAGCLEEIAEIEIKLEHYPQALQYLKKALSIRVWLKDQYHIDKINQRIIKVRAP